MFTRCVVMVTDELSQICQGNKSNEFDLWHQRELKLTPWHQVDAMVTISCHNQGIELMKWHQLGINLMPCGIKLTPWSQLDAVTMATT